MKKAVWILLILPLLDGFFYSLGENAFYFELHGIIEIFSLLTLMVYSLLQFVRYRKKSFELTIFFLSLTLICLPFIAYEILERINYYLNSDVLTLAELWIKIFGLFVLFFLFLYKLSMNLSQLIKDKSFRLVVAFAILTFPIPIILTFVSVYYLRISNIPIPNIVAGLTEAILMAFIGILALITFSMHFELELKYNWVVLSVSSVALIVGEIGDLFSQSYWPEIPLWIFRIFFNLFAVLLIIGLVMFQSGAAPYKSIKRLLKEREQFLFLNQELNQLLHDIAIMTQLLRHDLINDFAVIQSFIDLYLETKEQVFLERIKNRLKDATQRLEQVKSSTDIFVGLGLKPIDITALKDVASLFSNISVKIPNETITVLANQIFFTSIYNIILNAFEHGGTGTHVTLEVIEHPKSVEIIIADTGVGISADDKSIVFDLKYKGSNSSGEGIALHLIKNYIERIGGTITVTDNKPKGAKFIIRLPKIEYAI